MDPSCVSAFLFLGIFSTAWHSAHKKEKVTFLGECWDPQSELSNKQNAKSKILAQNVNETATTVIMGSTEPLKFCSESRIRTKIYAKSADRWTYAPPSWNLQCEKCGMILVCVDWLSFFFYLNDATIFQWILWKQPCYQSPWDQDLKARKEIFAFFEDENVIFLIS